MQYFQYNLFNSTFDELFNNLLISNEQSVIATINPHSFVVAENDPEFKSSLINSNYLLVDGIGIKMALYLQFKNVKLITGPDFHGQFIDLFRAKSLKVFYMGSTEVVLNKIKLKLGDIAPAWEVETYSPPFEKEFSLEQNNLILYNINKFKPDVLFVGMTAPKQEKWVEANKESIDAKYIASIGAVFDFYSGIKKSPPRIIVKFNLIWIYRLLTDFKHVWRRTFISVPFFIYYNLINYFKPKF